MGAVNVCLSVHSKRLSFYPLRSCTLNGLFCAALLWLFATNVVKLLLVRQRWIMLLANWAKQTGKDSAPHAAVECESRFGVSNMNFPFESSLFKLLYWLINTPGVGAVMISLIVGAALISFSLSLRSIRAAAEGN